MRMRGALLSGLAATAALALAGTAQGAVTIGSNLPEPNGFTNMPGCTIACTATNLTLPTASQAPGGLTSPANGTVTSWRLGANTAPNVRLRILRPAGALTFTGVGTSAPAGFAGPGISGPIGTSLPIQLGDAIGLENPDENLILKTTPGATIGFWNMPVLADGSTRTTDGTPNGVQVMVQATIEPTSTVTFGTVTRNKKKGTATLTITLPNAGQLAYSGTGVGIAGPASVGAPGAIQLTLSATGKKRKKLKKKGKVTVAPVLTFTPSNGSAATSSTSVKLVKKRKKR